MMAVSSLLIADLWAKVRIVTIDQLGEDFLQIVKTDD